jgi:uncharacterized membrane protein
MKIFKYSLVASALAFISAGSIAETYQVVDLGGVNNTRHSFATGVNNNGDVVGVSKDHFSYPIDLANLDFDALEIHLANAKIESPGVFDNVLMEDIRNGIINADAQSYILSYFNDRNTNVTVQKLGNQTGFLAEGAGTSELTFFDQVDAGFGSKTRNTQDLVNAINDNGVFVSSASALFTKMDYTPEATEAVPEPVTSVFWVKDFFDKKAVVGKGDQRVEIASPMAEYGGASYLTDISNNNYVVGYAAVGISAAGQDGLDINCVTLTDPAELYNCAWSVRNALLSNVNPQTLYRFRAYRWKLDDNLQVIEATDLGLMFTPKETDTSTYISIATGVNESGHVVGFSDGFKNQSDFDNDFDTRVVASYHDGTNQIDFIDHDTYVQSKALDLNDNNIVVGYATRLFSLVKTRQFFIYDGNTNTTTYPEGFFSSSASVANSINNAGIVVGTAEVESSFGTTRRKRGFSYDINTQAMTDLNTLTTCNNPYTIAEAKDINESGVIVGTALLTVQKRNSLGVVVLNDDGTAALEEVSRAVKMIPVAGGVVDDCTAVEAAQYERKGAGFGFAGLLLLSGLFGFRRLVR